MNGDLLREGGVGFGAALLLLVTAGLLLAWERGPGSRPHDPPVDHDAVRRIARGFVSMAAVWAIGGVWGFGGVLVIAAVTLLAAGAVTLVRGVESARSRKRPPRSAPVRRRPVALTAILGFG